MLKIRPQQADAVAASAFVDRTVAHVRRFHPRAVAGLTELELRARVVHCLARARGRGLTWEYSLTVFVAHMLTLCPTFDEHPEVARVLGGSPLPPDERMDELLREVPDAAWQQIAERCDGGAYWRRVQARIGGDA
jgi:hypothetical protein